MRIRDPGWRQFGSGIRDGKKSDPRSGINIPDPQHWTQHSQMLYAEDVGGPGQAPTLPSTVFEGVERTKVARNMCRKNLMPLKKSAGFGSESAILWYVSSDPGSDPYLPIRIRNTATIAYGTCTIDL
jgi:hypothetical protein